MFIDQRERVWMSWKGGYGCIDPDTFSWVERHAIPTEGAELAVEMLEDEAGTIWVLHQGMTLRRIKTGRVDSFLFPEEIGRLSYEIIPHNDHTSGSVFATVLCRCPRLNSTTSRRARPLNLFLTASMKWMACIVSPPMSMPAKAPLVISTETSISPLHEASQASPPTAF